MWNAFGNGSGLLGGSSGYVGKAQGWEFVPCSTRLERERGRGKSRSPLRTLSPSIPVGPFYEQHMPGLGAAAATESTRGQAPRNELQTQHTRLKKKIDDLKKRHGQDREEWMREKEVLLRQMADIQGGENRRILLDLKSILDEVQLEVKREETKRSELQLQYMKDRCAWELERAELKCRIAQLKLVALNTPLTGSMGSLTAADQACRSQAQAMGIRDQYRAFLSNHLQDLVDIIHPQYRRNLPVVNLRGEVLFDNFEHIFTKSSALPHGIPLFSFDGRDVMSDPFWPQKAIWHGSSPQGRRLQEKTCESWRAGDMAIVGQASFLYSGLLTQQSRSCSNQFVVLCLETSPDPPGTGYQEARRGGSTSYQEARRGTRYAYYYYRNPISSQRT